MGRLFWKFFFAYWLALLLAGFGVGSAVWLYRQSDQEADRRIDTHGHAGALVSAGRATLQHGGPEALRGLLDHWAKEPLPPVYAVDDGGRDLLGRPMPAELLAQARAIAIGGSHPGEVQTIEAAGGQHFLIFAARPPSPPFPPPAAGGAAVRGPPPPGPRPPPLVPVAAGIFASLGFSAWLAWYLSQPIRNLRTAFAALAAGRLETRAAPMMGRRRDEIAGLGTDFDHMAVQIGNLVSAQRRLLHDVSHELRSPLARLQAAIGLARQQPDRTGELLDRVERESERLDRLVGELLTLSRLEAGMPEPATEPFDLAELMLEIVEDARFEAQGRGIRVALHSPSDLAYRGRVELIHRAIENVVRNAVQHSPDEGMVEVSLEVPAGGDCLILAVRDQGEGVPEAQLSAIFEPFFRSARQKRKDGSGLGLAIARLAVEAHGGTIRASNCPAGGLRMELRLPSATMPEPGKPAAAP